MMEQKLLELTKENTMLRNRLRMHEHQTSPPPPLPSNYTQHGSVIVEPCTNNNAGFSFLINLQIDNYLKV